LLNLMAGLIDPTSGTVRIENQIINEMGNNSLSKFLLFKLGMIFQSFNLLPTYTIYENIEVALAPMGLTGTEIQKLITPYLDQFGLTDKLNLFPEELSMGQQQKVAVIRTLVRHPSIILADEPTASVDETAGREILETLINKGKSENVTIILATHGIVPESIADRTYIIDNGILNSK
jgi:putative ABC transport system ATP-binding protein